MRRIIRSGIVVAAATLSVTACATLQNDNGIGAPRIAGTDWTLRTLDAAPAPTRNTSATLTFGRDGSVVGTLACNHAGGIVGWRVEGEFTGLDAPVIITTAGCRNQEDEIAFGNRFWSRLQPGSTWRRTGDTLSVRFADGGGAMFARRR